VIRRLGGNRGAQGDGPGLFLHAQNQSVLPPTTRRYAMAQAPPLTLIFHGKIRRQSGGRTGFDSAALE